VIALQVRHGGQIGRLAYRPAENATYVCMRFGMIVGHPRIRCGLRSLLSRSDRPPKKLVTLNIRNVRFAWMQRIFISFMERKELVTAKRTHRCVCRFIQPRHAVTTRDSIGAATRRLVEISIPAPPLPLAIPPCRKRDFLFEMVSSLAEITWRYQRRNLPGRVRLALRLARHHPGAAHLGGVATSR